MTPDKIHNKSFLSKYKDIDDKIISEYVSSVPESFSEAIHILSSFDSTKSDPEILLNRSKLQNLITNFHQSANTTTTGVNNSIRLLNLPDTQVLVTTHQPNLFAFGGVFKKIVLIQALKNALGRHQNTKSNFVNLFVIIDHDFMNEIWIRRAQLPSIRHAKGILEIRLPINKSNKWNMVGKMPLPRREIVDHWKWQIFSWIKNQLASSFSHSSKMHLLENFSKFWEEVEDSYSKAKTYSDFNSFLLSQIVNRIWGYDVLFTRLSDVSSVFESGYRHLIQHNEAYNDALREAEKTFLKYNVNFPPMGSNSYTKAPIWIHCKCGSKSSAKLSTDSHNQILLEGVCISCKKDLCINLGNKNKLDGLKDNLDNISPKAIPILLLLSMCLGSICYVSGSGGVGYMVYGSGTYNALRIKRPVNVFWPSRDIIDGFGQSEALQHIGIRNHSDVDVYLKSLREKEILLFKNIKPILEERELKVRSGQQIENLLSDLSSLKQEQREIRKKIKVSENVRNATNLAPCIVDYAVNFGIRNMETQWRKNLLENDHLHLPVKLSN